MRSSFGIFFPSTVTAVFLGNLFILCFILLYDIRVHNTHTSCCCYFIVTTAATDNQCRSDSCQTGRSHHNSLCICACAVDYAFRTYVKMWWAPVTRTRTQYWRFDDVQTRRSIVGRGHVAYGKEIKKPALGGMTADLFGVVIAAAPDHTFEIRTRGRSASSYVRAWSK